jgi:hypothetical protein
VSRRRRVFRCPSPPFDFTQLLQALKYVSVLYVLEYTLPSVSGIAYSTDVKVNQRTLR